MSLIDWEKAWSDVTAASPLGTYRSTEARWDEYWDYIAASYGDLSAPNGENEDIIRYLYREGVLSEGDTVLDIGSGPGTFSIPLSKKASHVTCIDISSLMLENLEVSMLSSRISNISPVRSSWGSYEPANGFDLVFSAFCPGINDMKSLLKMERLSKKYCCYITGDLRQFYMLQRVWSALTGETCAADAYSINYPYNALMHAGRRPKAAFFYYRTAGNVHLDDIVNEFTIYFSTFMHVDNEKKGIIKNIVHANSSGGQYRISDNRSTCVLYWAVPRI